MDKRIAYRIVIDTETCPVDKSIDKVDPYNMFVYDIGWAVVDKRGNVYETYSFVNADIYLGEKSLMRSAYYADKLPQYEKDIAEGTRKLATMAIIRKILLESIKRYNVKQIYAHNMRFDYGTLNNTQRWTSKSKYRYFFPFGVEICDTLRMSRDVLGNMPTYKKFCAENGYLDRRGKPRFTAEIIYRFITGENDFIESHTGLEDVMIEKDILAYCFRQHKKMNRFCFNNR